MEWLKFIESPDADGLLRSTTFLTDPSTPPNTRAELEALKSLARSLKTLSPDRFEPLYSAYKQHTPAVVLRGGVERTARTLAALLNEGITPDQLNTACRMSLIRDVGAQLTASTAAYTGSFFTLNALTSVLMRDKADDPVQLGLPQLAHTAASLLVARFLRAAEMGPGWTRPVEADSKGAASAAILTKPGFAKTVAQYWPFFAPLLWASLALPDPADTLDAAEKLERSAARVEFRRDFGFAASAGVALHRMYAFDREHVWLDASTEPKRLAMLAAIDELTSPLKTVASLGKYAVVRPTAGLAGLLGWDAHPTIIADFAAGTQSVSISGSLQKKGLSATRGFLLMAPMAVFSLARSFTATLPRYSDLINVANDAILIGGWGYAMAHQERMIATDAPALGSTTPEKSLQAENAARAKRQITALAARRTAPAQPAPVQL